MAFLVAGLIVVGVLVAAVVAGNRTLRNADGSGSGIVDALGNFTDVFEPSRARAARDLKDFENAGPVTPVPDDDEGTTVQVQAHVTGVSDGVATIAIEATHGTDKVLGAAKATVRLD